MEGSASLMKGLYKVRGDFSFMMNWDEIFGTVKTGDGSAGKADTEADAARERLPEAYLKICLGHFFNAEAAERRFAGGGAERGAVFKNSSRGDCERDCREIGRASCRERV